MGPAETSGQMKESGGLDVFLEISNTRKKNLVQDPIDRVSHCTLAQCFKVLNAGKFMQGCQLQPACEAILQFQVLKH
jgi:hypothetical protein